MIYLKDGLHTSPLLGLNVVQYTKPLTNFKNAQGSPKNGLRRSANAILRRYCRLKTDVKIIIQSRDIAGSFCYSLAKSNVFAPLTSLRDVQRKTLLPRAMGCTPFLAHYGPKNSLRFSAHKVDSKKIGANKRTEKIAPSNFCLPIFC